MKVRLVRKGWKKNTKHFSVIVKPGKNLFDFMQNVQSAAFFAVNDLSPAKKIPHDELFSMKPFFGKSTEKFDRRALRIK